MKQPYTVPSTVRRDWLIGIAVGLVFLGAVIYAVTSLSGGLSGSTLNGKVVAKHFTPQPEEQITIGKGGFNSRHKEGEYVLECVVKGRSYLVTVDQQTYEHKAVGEVFLFSRPIDESTAK